MLALGLRNGVALNGRLVLWVASRCAEAACAPPVSAAARAAAAMTIRAFCLSLGLYIFNFNNKISLYSVQYVYDIYFR